MGDDRKISILREESAELVDPGEEEGEREETGQVCEEDCLELDVEEDCLELDVEEDCLELDVEEDCLELGVEEDCLEVGVEEDCLELGVLEDCLEQGVDEDFILLLQGNSEMLSFLSILE